MKESNAKGMLIRGRFESSLSEVMEQINASIGFDQKMAMQDIDGSLAHAEMLSRQGIITHEDFERIAQGLIQIREEIINGTFVFSRALEDIHINIESRLNEIIGATAGRLHTARSRNDQVATSFRLWVRDAHDRAISLVKTLMQRLLEQAQNNITTIMPGFTHLQSAQPVTFGHHLMAYIEMFSRDLSRLQDSRHRMNESPLGAAALAGTSFPIDRDFSANLLKFDHPMHNSLDAVSDRDFAIEYLSTASLCMTHLSRLADEIVLWMSPQFRFIQLSDAWTTGSSIMPQKRNPDAAELIRGKTGRVHGSLMGLLTVMKALPLTFSKDMQEDKEQTFDAAETLELCLKAMCGMIGDLKAQPESMLAAAGTGHATATDLADWLTRELNMPFREAHHITGRLVRLADEQNCSLSDLTLEQMQSIESRISSGLYKVLTVEDSVASRQSLGGTSPVCIQKEIDRWHQRLAD
ncbi:argininosuccinate lyase [Pantoea sp. PA1]|uniref:argininosuccinate lyase n=1 Tax=Pantoea ananas TaxID=553 RepID=UPI000349B63D|nr:argininosuccinate lyase [Pantoea ananatis]MDH0055614.1 argininosuccinate lyase [Pantoea ananatis]PQK79134.1 argininosuccinate lyase [Pantoea ananatis]RAR72121.1 argininosuccinate lyase [Pantoea ananatis]SKA70754.1 argininosuccinate lyase [Pantoea ananatis]